MHFLFLSNYYPPHNQGGYEQLCQEVAYAFVARGHQVTILTGRVAGKKSVEADGPVRVYRHLELELEGGMLHTTARLVFGRKASERRNVAAIEHIIAGFAPDAALIWGMWNVPRVVPATIERLLPSRVAYYFCDYWPTLPNAYIQRLREPARSGMGRVPKKAMTALWLPGLLEEKSVELSYHNAACVSRAVRDQLVEQGIGIDNAAIIHLGIDPMAFTREGRPPNAAELRLVYAGRLSQEKGVHTAIDALNRLNGVATNAVSLDIYGTGHPDYVAHLRHMTPGNALVMFHGAVPREKLARALPRYDAFLFPSEWQEPFSHAVLEAMVSGLAVIGTTTGGTGEILVEGETGLTFRPGDAADLARQIARLGDDPELRERLAAAGREVVLREFSIDRTVDQLEILLTCVAANSARQSA